MEVSSASISNWFCMSTWAETKKTETVQLLYYNFPNSHIQTSIFHNNINVTYVLCHLSFPSLSLPGRLIRKGLVLWHISFVNQSLDKLSQSWFFLCMSKWYSLQYEIHISFPIQISSLQITKFFL